jgi:peptidase E
LKKDHRRIIAMGGSSWLLDYWVLYHSGYFASPKSPKVCYLPTACGDDCVRIRMFEREMVEMGCVVSHLSLFDRTVDDIESFLLKQDMIFVGGGNTANMLAVWRVHGVDKILRQAWEQGILLCGYSAGGLCWFEGGVTDSFGGTDALNDGLGFLAGSFCPHYNSERSRRPVYERLVRTQKLPPGVAADEGVALCYEGTDLVRVVRASRGGVAWSVHGAGSNKLEGATDYVHDDLRVSRE